MTKKVVLDPGDYEKLVIYISSQHGYFNTLVSPVEVDAIFKRAILVDIPDAPVATTEPEKKEE
jgi:hypothetical protein